MEHVPLRIFLSLFREPKRRNFSTLRWCHPFQVSLSTYHRMKTVALKLSSRIRKHFSSRCPPPLLLTLKRATKAKKCFRQERESVERKRLVFAGRGFSNRIVRGWSKVRPYESTRSLSPKGVAKVTAVNDAMRQKEKRARRGKKLGASRTIAQFANFMHTSRIMIESRTRDRGVALFATRQWNRMFCWG